MSDISARLSFSNRTLQRRPAGQGHTFQDLIDTACRDLAEQLLRETVFALAEIAFLAGALVTGTLALGAFCTPRGWVQTFARATHLR